MDDVMGDSGTVLDLTGYFAWPPMIPWFLFLVPVFLLFLVVILDWSREDRFVRMIPYACVLLPLIGLMWNAGVMSWTSATLDGVIGRAYGMRALEVQRDGLDTYGVIDGSKVTYVDADGRFGSGTIRTTGEGRFIAIYPDVPSGEGTEPLKVIDPDVG